MSQHGRSCVCDDCLSEAFEALALIEKMALAFQIQASWHGWRLDQPPRWAGDDPTLPRVPEIGWSVWFATHDAMRRAMILAQAAIVIEAEMLLARA